METRIEGNMLIKDMTGMQSVKLTHRTSGGTLVRSDALLNFTQGRIEFLKSPFALKDEIKSMAQEINSKKREMNKLKKELSTKIKAKMMFFGEKVAKPKKPKKEKVQE